MKKNKNLLKLKKELQAAMLTIGHIKASAVGNNSRLMNDCDLLHNASASILHYVVNMIDEYKE